MVIIGDGFGGMTAARILRDVDVILVEADSRILPGFHQTLSAKARASLVQMGVTVILNKFVTAVRPDGVMVGDEWVM